MSATPPDYRADMLLPRCAEASLACDEALAGTATEGVTMWIALEYREAWQRNTLSPGSLPLAAREHLQAALNRISGARLQWIRRVGRQRDGLNVIVGLPFVGHGIDATEGADDERRCAPTDRLFRREIHDYAELLQVDFERLRDGDLHGGFVESAQPVALVCAHGRRDRCCGELGAALYREMRMHSQIDVWQTSHIGGHRFAPCVVTLPDGGCFGRVPTSRGLEFCDSRAGDALFSLDYFRGHCGLLGHEQAAEVAVRRAYSLDRIGACQWLNTSATSDGWCITLASFSATYEVEVQRAQRLGVARHKSCGDEVSPVFEYAIRSIRAA